MVYVLCLVICIVLFSTCRRIVKGPTPKPPAVKKRRDGRTKEFKPFTYTATIKRLTVVFSITSDIIEDGSNTVYTQTITVDETPYIEFNLDYLNAYYVTNDLSYSGDCSYRSLEPRDDIGKEYHNFYLLGVNTLLEHNNRPDLAKPMDNGLLLMNYKAYSILSSKVDYVEVEATGYRVVAIED